MPFRRLTLSLAAVALPVIALAQRHAAETLPLTPSAADMITVQVSLVGALRQCLPTDGWTLHAHVVVDHATGRLTVTPPDGTTWTPQETRCFTRASAHVRGRRFTSPDPFATDLTLEGRDPRGDQLRAIDVRTCYPEFDACRCHLNVAVATSARRPQMTSGVTWDVQGCLPTADQLGCVERLVSTTVWPVHVGDPGSFRGIVGPRCGGP